MPAARRATRRVRSYTAVFEPQRGGGYTVTVPALPGCVSEGETLAEARTMAADAIRAYCESLILDGVPLPKDVVRRPVLEKLSVSIAAR